MLYPHSDPCYKALLWFMTPAWLDAKVKELSNLLANTVMSLAQYEYNDPEDYMFLILHISMLNSS